MKSLWKEISHRPEFQPLKKDIKTDVLIIGGGLAGILCAFELQKAGVDYVLVEADKICSGITQNTTAKISLAHGLIYNKIISSYGTERAQQYLSAQLEAIKKYEHLCYDIECDFEKCSSFVYSMDNSKKIEDEIIALNKIGYKAEFEKNLPLPFSVAGAVRVDKQAQFHPLKFAFSIAKDLNIYESTKILELTPNGAITHSGKIKADKTIVTTHFPFINKHGFYFVKMFQERSYVLALENACKLSGNYIDENKKGLSFRDYNNLLLLGGSNHRTGKKSLGWQELSDFSKQHYPRAKEICRWATQDCITLDSIPYIGQYSPSTPNLYVATGFNKWGITSSMISAQILKDSILGNSSPYSEVFNPQRSIFHPQLMINISETTVGLLNPKKPRCPHLGCALEYNSAEHSWDCSCHGSRFTEQGQLINNPATDDTKIR